ncbi:M1 family metallopeptidase [Leptolyngbya sp. FACHB-261]|uniref:M1 family metallopeptidase n=1 Tax=Leptolyngbya sp. FACHB-261 TaxID=2692806 RepID=UPI0016857718|nr:M1 family metallopeptidase [Leptolyngbya sp. FACHB-261]MBD2102047.1 M1 family metallopeptidase [Leptolyngbya sp. FACHB-261]
MSRKQRLGWENLYLDEAKTKSFELPGARPHYNPDRPGQVEHIALDLTLDLEQQRVAGLCQIRLNPVRDGLTDLTLDAVSLQIEQVEVAGTAQPFDYDGEFLKVRLQEPTRAGAAITLEIAYHIDHPQRGIYFIAPTEHYPNKPVQVWTQGEDEDSRFWFPCFDYPGQLATSEIKVKVPKDFLVISNGELQGVEEVNGSKTYHWYQPQVHPTYLMTLAVGKFAELRDEWHSIPVTYYVEKGREEDARRTMGKTPRMIEFFSEQYGYAYPYPKYAQVCVDDFIFGGMENTSTTLLTDRCLLDERAAIDNRNAESLVAHELCHQWFGDLVVIKHWSHAWIKEGMASYSEIMWTDHEYGPQEAAYYRLNEARNYFSEDSGRYRRPIVTHVYREAIELYDRHLYEKGACVYHMLRAELGEDLFWKAIQTFVRDHAHKTVETVDLLRAIDKSTGRNLAFLFDQYVFRGGHPEYKVAYAWDGDSHLAKVTITQSQTELFDLKLPIAFAFDDGKQFQTFTVRVHEKEQSFYFPLASKPQFVSFDQGNHFLKKVTLEYGLAELKAQLQFSPDPLDRIYAAEALARKGNLEAVKALEQALLEDAFWGVRLEVAEALGSIKLDQATESLAKGLQDSEARVRRAVILALSGDKAAESYQLIQPFLEQGDPSYLVEAAAATSLGTIAASSISGVDLQQTVQLLKTTLETKAGWNEVVRTGATAGLAKLKESDEALDLLLQYTALGTPQALRLAAIRSLGTFGSAQTKVRQGRVIERLRQLGGETFFLTQVSTVVALGQLDTPEAISILSGLVESTPDGRVRRMAEEAVQRVQQKVGTDGSLKQLREELDQLKKDNQDLKSRLESIEAKSSQTSTSA